MSPRGGNAPFAHPRRGTIVVVVALVLVSLMAFAALIIDLGYLRLVHAELQVSADASAMAGAARLNRGATGMDAAANMATALAALNGSNGDALILDPNPDNSSGGDLVLGVWDAEAQTFTPSLTAKEVNAVKVLARNPGVLPFFSGVAFGRGLLGAKALAIATHTALGAGEVPFYLPFAVPRCLLDHWDKDTLQSMTFVLSPEGADNTGWAAINDHPSASWVQDQLDLAMVCMKLWAETGLVTSQCTPAVVGASVGLNNGVINSGLKAVADHIEDDGIPWDTEAWGTITPQHSGSAIAKAKYGQMIVGPLPVIDGGLSYCSASGGSWNQNAPLLGFVWGALYDVRTSGAAVAKNVWVRINVKSNFEIGNWPGGGNWGVTATGPSEVVQ